MMKCEMSSRKVLPAIRRALVTELSKTGKKQNEIARMLHITPAAVTQYIKGKRAKVKLNEKELEGVVELAKISLEAGELEEKNICKLCDEVGKRLAQ
ncbi:MAG: hypothetical protein GOU98_02965 [Candidatus Altiarchaeota archaeon]|nr:hypothetical protein [Candidatus Altiarchaeota archaeon]